MDRRLVIAVVVFLVALGVANAGLAGSDPLEPKERLNARDSALAKQTVVQRSDLGPRWRARVSPGPSGCPRAKTDLSRFTISGIARASFSTRKGSIASSYVKIFANAGQASLFFQARNSRAVLRCMRDLVARGLRANGLVVRTLSASMARKPVIGEQTAIYSVMYAVTLPDGRRTRYPVDLLAFQMGRAVGAVSFNYVVCWSEEVALTRLVAYRSSRSMRRVPASTRSAQCLR